MEVEEEDLTPPQGNNISVSDVPISISGTMDSDMASIHSSICTETSSKSDDYIDAVNKQISGQQLKLQNKDRILINEEIHGVTCNARFESPELVLTSMNNVFLELCAQVQKDQEAVVDTTSCLSAGYILSQRGDGPNTYVNGADFQLRFLRSENFDAKKAAIRMMKYLNLILEYFGPFALYRPIMMTDFSRRECKILQNGWLQILPFRDRSGRRVFIWAGDLGFQYDAIIRLKLTLYVFLAGTRDAESQRKGTVSLIWIAPSHSVSSSSSVSVSSNMHSMDPIYTKESQRVIEAIPIKVASTHFCALYGDHTSLSPYVRRVCKSILSLCDPIVSYLSPRIRFHVGKENQLTDTLSSYGIPVKLIPITTSGHVKTVYFRQWLQLQRNIDDESHIATAGSFIDCPGSNDVVFRSGSTMICNPGNVMFRSLIESKIEEALLQGFSAKTKDGIAMEIFEEVVRDRKGRFLKWDNKNECWTECTCVLEVRKKIAVTYRDLKLKTIMKI